jgi:hypothetical protein
MGIRAGRKENEMLPLKLLLPPATRPPVYTVARIVRGPAHLARLLGGQLLLVRGVIWGCEAGVAGPGTRCLSLQPVLVDPRTGARMAVILDLPVRGAPIQHIRWGRPTTYRAPGPAPRERRLRARAARYRCRADLRAGTRLIRSGAFWTMRAAMRRHHPY